MVNIDSFTYIFGEENTGGCKATRRPKKSKPTRSKQLSIEMNTADIDCLFQREPSY